MFVCKEENCGRHFKRKYDLKNHIKHSHLQQVVERCFLCGQTFQDYPQLQDHYSNFHKPSRRFTIKESAFKKKFLTYRYTFLPNERNPDSAQFGIKNLIRRQILSEAAKRVISRVSLILIAEMIMVDHQGEKVSKASIPFRSPTFFTNAANQMEVEKNVSRSFTHQKSSMEEFMRSGSGWQFSRAIAFDVEISTVKPISGGGALKQITVESPLDLDLAGFSRNNKRFLYNPPNKDNKCFLYCIAYFILFGALVNKKLTVIDELRIKKQSSKFKIKNTNFPMTVCGISKFLKNNHNLDLKINVVLRGNNQIYYPMEYGLGEGKKIVNILLAETNIGNHFLLITDADKFFRKVYNIGTDKQLSYQKTFFCLHCLNHFHSIKVRDAHVRLCSVNKPRIETVKPAGQNIIKFKNYEHQHKLDYIAFLDFECILPNTKQKCVECRSLKCKCECSFTDEINKQLPITYSFVILGPSEKIIHEHTYSGKDAHINCLAHLLEQEETWLKTLLEKKNWMKYSEDDKNNFESSKSCYLCGIEFDESVIKCRDHSHVTAKYLGAACQSCNLRRRRSSKLRIFVHNCSKYDMHFLIKAIPHLKEQVHYTSALPYNGEHFRTLRINSFEFLDSLAFLQASLGHLSADLQESGHDYKILKQTYLSKKHGKFNNTRFKMVLEKSFFPYEYCTSYEKMISTKKIPPQSKFYSCLSEEGISDGDYEFAKNVWKEFNCSNLLDYTELYCKIDTILLAELFQIFRNKMHKFSGLDPAYYISLPAFGYDTMLKMTGNEIELPTDINMVHFLENAKRGGVSFINTRYISTSDTDPGDIVYCDRNNLYGEAQLQKLPYNSFRWMTETEIKDFSVLTVDTNGEFGYIVECDLHYPKKLHRAHSNFPLAPELLEVGYENLSPYAKAAIQFSTGRKSYKDVKLMSTFHDKTEYVTHIKNLVLYISLGMELKKIHRILQFRQEEIFKPYIMKTTEARHSSKTKFDMDFFKKLVRLKH